MVKNLFIRKNKNKKLRLRWGSNPQSQGFEATEHLRYRKTMTNENQSQSIKNVTNFTTQFFSDQ